MPRLTAEAVDPRTTGEGGFAGNPELVGVNQRNSTRLALVHDYLLVLRGAERTFAALTDLWPDAPIVTLLYDPAGTRGRFEEHAITTSSVARLGARQANFRRLMPLYPTAVQRLPLEGFDCVVSSSSAFAHGVRPPEDAAHVCYCHSPFRYAWHEQECALSELPRPLRPALSLMLRRHRSFDRRAARGVHQYVANSKITRDRMRRFWGRDAPIVHPPVDVDRFSIGEPADYVLFVGELVRHKRPELAIHAAAAAGRRLKLVGAGPELPRLRAKYGHQADFLGHLGEQELTRAYSGAQALIVPNVEEFGIAAVEAQAAGRPVVGVDAGGLRETVVHDRTGLLVPPGDPDALAGALRQDFSRFDPHDIRAHAERFDRSVFQKRMRDIVEETCRSRQS
ncbi:MAG TPA: glycosyltransferase [Polyangiaceae bacterium]|nr:glycosyltransferase [Ardenticatenaceae bacterium]HYO95940.1 glycosyltransferase [Polyangiaceae bacterium]